MKNKSVLILAAIIVFVFLGVLIVYWNTFGFHLSGDHTRWAEFGSFFGGFLGVMFAGFSVFYLALQIKSQIEENRRARESAEIERREDEIRTYTSLITTELEKKDEKTGLQVRELILKIHRNEENLKMRPDLDIVAFSGRSEIVLIWFHIAVALNFLKVTDEHRYVNQLSLMMAQLSRQLCVALEDVVSLAFDGPFAYHFSTKEEIKN